MYPYKAVFETKPALNASKQEYNFSFRNKSFVKTKSISSILDILLKAFFFKHKQHALLK